MVLLKVGIILFFLNLSTIVFAHSQTAVIEMTEGGFKPSEATLDSSSAVIFINKDTKPHWPASDIHPTHDIYPEFDPKKRIEPGESWAFRLKPGEWRFHDHLFPHINGKLIVFQEVGAGNNHKVQWLEEFKKMLGNILNKVKLVFSVSKKIQAIDKEDFIKLNPQGQFKNLQDLADSKGGLAAWEYVKATYIGQAGSSGNIHDLAHLAGSLIYKDKGFEGIRSCSSDFGFGCFHGFLDEAFKKSIEKLKDAHKACLKLDSNLSGPVASCIHGIGHGVASFFSVSDLKKALSACRKLESGSEYCFDGVFMEFARNAPDNYIKKDDPLYPCDDLEKDFGYAYSSACGRNQPPLLLGRFKMNFEQVIPVCLSSSSAPFKESCIDSLGFSLASSGDSEKIIRGCRVIGDAVYIKRCIKAAAGELVFQDVPGWEQKSKEVCESFMDNLDECLFNINMLVSDYHRVRK